MPIDERIQREAILRRLRSGPDEIRSATPQEMIQPLPEAGPIDTAQSAAIDAKLKMAGMMPGTLEENLPIVEKGQEIALGTMGGIKKVPKVAELPVDVAKTKYMKEFHPDDWYHGTTANIEAFDPKKLGEFTGAKSAEKGFFFSSQPEVASAYAEARGMDKYDLATENSALKSNRNIAEMQIRGATERKRRAEQLLKELENKPNKTENEQFRLDYAKKEIKQTSKSIEDRSKQLKEIEEYEKKNLIEGPARIKAAEEAERGGNVIPAKLKMKNPKIVDLNNSFFREKTYTDIIDEAKAAGHDSVILKNTWDQPMIPGRTQHSSNIAVVFEPSQIRSKFAKFDPKKKKSGNILAGAAGAAISNKLMKNLGEENE